MPLGPFIGTRKISNPPQLSARQDAPNNHFIATNPSNFFQNQSKQLGQKRSLKEPFYRVTRLHIKNNKASFYNNL